MNRQLAILTGLYVGVVLTAQVSANKIIELPFTHLAAPAGTYLIGLALALIETAHHTAPTRREGWKNAQLMIAMGFAGSAVLAIWIAIVNEMNSVGPDRFGFLAGTWRIVVGSLAAFAVSETIDNGLGAIDLRTRAELSERGDDDLEAAARLLVCIGRRRLAVGHDRSGSRDVDVVADAHGP